MGALIDITGETFGRLTVTSRTENSPSGRAKWNCTCSCGKQTVCFSTNLLRGLSRSCGCLSAELNISRRLPPDAIKYGSAHARVYRTRGKASTHQCVDCGLPAQEWSLSRASSSTLYGQANGYLCRYSGDPADYEPRCSKCHRAHDLTPKEANE